MRFDTELLQFDAAPGDPHTPTSTPIYQTATFAQETPGEHGRYDYTRSGNPTRAVLESQIARLERGARAFAFASGMAAISTVTQLLSAGDEIVAGDDLYGGIHRLLTQVLARRGVTVRFVDTTNLDAVRQALGPRTRMLLVETPTNPLHRVSDLVSLAHLAHSRSVWLVVDSSQMSPYLQRPLELGADLVVHSATKFLSGHSDLTAGLIVARENTVADQIAFLQNAEGAGLAPFECWLLLRGLKTLALRIDRQQATARSLATFLQSHPLITRVHYAGLEDHPGHSLHHDQAVGPGSVLSCETGDLALSRGIIESTRLHATCVSFGGVGSTISLPCAMSHASIPAEVRRSRSLPEDLVRISAGIEDPEDLTDDLARALAMSSSAVERK